MRKELLDKLQEVYIQALADILSLSSSVSRRRNISSVKGFLEGGTSFGWCHVSILLDIQDLDREILIKIQLEDIH